MNSRKQKNLQTTESCERQMSRMVTLAAVPFAVIAATTVKSGVTTVLMFSVLLMLSMMLHSVLSLVSRIIPGLGMAVCSVAVMLLGGMMAWLVRSYLPGYSEAMGLMIYLPGAAVLTVLPRKRCGFQRSLKLGLRESVHFSMIVLPISLLRELFAYNRVWELALPAHFTAPGARMPFFGYVLAGLTVGALAVLTGKRD